MGCGCTKECNFFEVTEVEMNSNENNNQIEEINPKQLSAIIRIQSYQRGMIVRKAVQSQINELKQINDNFNNISNLSDQSVIEINDEELKLLLKTYPPLNDNVKVEIILPVEYPSKNSLYYGEWDINNNIRHGRGISAWFDGSKYSGYWVEDKASIKGKLIHSNGDIYEGEWSDDKPNGKGIYIYQNGTVYEGEWKDDFKNGFGKEKYVDGAWYEGEFKNGNKDGKGKFHWKDNSYYEGDFVENNISGKGIYIFNDKRKYEGNWYNNQMNGYGVFTWPDGRKYEGNYKNDNQDGYGTFTWSDGKQYKGHWVNGKQHGEGEIFSPSQNIWQKGIWDNGKRIKWIE